MHTLYPVNRSSHQSTSTRLPERKKNQTNNEKRTQSARNGTRRFLARHLQRRGRASPRRCPYRRSSAWRTTRLAAEQFNRIRPLAMPSTTATQKNKATHVMGPVGVVEVETLGRLLGSRRGFRIDDDCARSAPKLIRLSKLSTQSFRSNNKQTSSHRNTVAVFPRQMFIRVNPSLRWPHSETHFGHIERIAMAADGFSGPA